MLLGFWNLDFGIWIEEKRRILTIRLCQGYGGHAENTEGTEMKSWMKKILKWWMLRKVKPMEGVSVKTITVKSSDVIVLWVDRSVNPFRVNQAREWIVELNICRDVIVMQQGIEVGVIQAEPQRGREEF